MQEALKREKKARRTLGAEGRPMYLYQYIRNSIYLPVLQ